MPTPAETIVFQGFVLDRKHRRLLDADGRTVPLSDRGFDVLVCLIENRARFVSVDTIMARVWDGLAVERNNVTVQISNLRKALGKHGGSDLIINVQKSGYRFVGEIGEIGEPAPDAKTDVPQQAPWGRATRPRRRAIIVSGAAALVAVVAVFGLQLAQLRSTPAGPDALSLAVLPFRDLTDGDSGFMAEAITADLTTELTQIPGSKITSYGSADLFRNRAVPIARIGVALNVRYLLDGTLRVDQRGYHIDADLVDAATGQAVWASKFDVPRDQLADTQTAIVRAIASALDVDLPTFVAAHPRPDDPQAERAFVQAVSLTLHQDTQEAFTAAQRLLRQALRLRPDFSEARAELGLTLVRKVAGAVDPTRKDDLTEAARDIAQALNDPDNQIALAANARFLEVTGHCPEAVASAQEALRLVSNNVDALAVLAKCATDSGKLDQAAAAMKTLLQLNPDPARDKPRLALLSQIDLLQGRYEAAVSDGERALAGEPLPQPGADTMGRAEYATLLVISATALSGDTASAQALYAEYRRAWPNRSVWRVAAYSPKGLAAQPGFKNFTEGLRRAGMPPYSDPAGADAAPAIGDFAPAPAAVPPAVTIDTAGMAQLSARPGVTILDLGHGAAVPPGATLVGPDAVDGGTPSSWLPGTVRANQAAEIVVMADGIYGSAAVAAVRGLCAAGYRHVYWYRGGEEQWAAAGRAAEDRRPQF